jgi:hypothetical protein
MIYRRIAIAFFLISAYSIGAVVLRARGQATARPGDMTQARVWVENRSPNEAVPVVVENVATPITAHLDTNSTVQTVVARQTWQYRSELLPVGTSATVLDRVGTDGWEAVGLIQTGPMGATILFKRPR